MDGGSKHIKIKHHILYGSSHKSQPSKSAQMTLNAAVRLIHAV